MKLELTNELRAVPPSVSGDETPARIIDSVDRILESYSDYLSDESRAGPSRADRLVFPRNEGHVSEVLAAASKAAEAVTISSGRTGIVGGAVPDGGTVLSLADMNKILGVRWTSRNRWAVRAQPGIPLAEFWERVASKELGIDRSRLSPLDISDLDAFLSDPTEYFYPPDPTEDTAHLGGTLATNASGARSFRYGPTRGHVTRLRVCLATGDVLDITRGDSQASYGRFGVSLPDGRTLDVELPTYAMPRVKNAAGYFCAPDMDPIDLFIGSEGTLGVITEAEILLCPKPEGVLSAMAFFPSDEEAIGFVIDARGDRGGSETPVGVRPIALEFFDSRSLEFLRERKADEGPPSEIPELPRDAASAVLFEQDFVEDSLLEVYEGWETLLARHGSSMDKTWGGMDDADLMRLRALRHGVPEQVNSFIARAKSLCEKIHKVGTDTAVPNGELVSTFSLYRSRLEEAGFKYVIFGHIGDNHLHVNIMPTNEDELNRGKELAHAFAKHAAEVGGTVAAEHGIGRLKHDFLLLMYGESGVREMAAVKRMLDPEAILNRGVLFPATLI